MLHKTNDKQCNNNLSGKNIKHAAWFNFHYWLLVAYLIMITTLIVTIAVIKITIPPPPAAAAATTSTTTADQLINKIINSMTESKKLKVY